MPAPVGGWNTRDPLELMDPRDAVVLDNWTPKDNGVEVRPGYAAHQSPGSGNVDTVAEYQAGATRKLLASSNGNIYDATSSPSSLASGFSVNRWQTAQLGSNMGWVNGTDAPQVYNGSTVGAMTLTGPTAANVIGIMTHRSRSYFWEENSGSFWFSAVDTMGGTVTEFPLRNIGILGNIICAGSWNVEGGESNWGGGGIGEDMAVFVMSNGDFVVYRGSDPGSDFVLVGVYGAGEPVDVRGVARLGSDLVVLTREGVISCSALVQSGAFTPSVALSDKIRPTVKKAVSDYAANTGWQLVTYPTESLLLLNVPVSTTEFHQYVLNYQKGAWARWKDIPARSWGRYNNGLYFGDTSANVRELTGNADIAAEIATDLQTSYQPLAGRGNICRVSAMRPLFKGLEAAEIGITAQFDFKQSMATLETISFGPVSDNWEEIEVDWENWDEANWEGAITVPVPFHQWRVASGQGYVASARITTSTDARLSMETIAYQVEAGRGFI